MKYQLADLHNGPFGDVYENLADAEKALEEAIAEGQAFNDEYAQECADAGCEVPRAADFFSIVEGEAWDAWEDGARDDAVRFIVPAGGGVDIAEAGAAALGVDVSEQLNVARV